MKTTTLIFCLGLALALSTSFAADKERSDKISADAAFIKNASDAGMTEVELGKVTEKMGRGEESDIEFLALIG